MQTNKTDPNHLLSPAAQELEHIVSHVLQHMPVGKDSKEGIALIHFLQGITLDEWEEVIQKYPCDNCMALPLEQAEALSILTESQHALALMQARSTGNRFITQKAFLRILGTELARAKRTGGDITVAVIELDSSCRNLFSADSPEWLSIVDEFSFLLSQSVEPFDSITHLNDGKFAILFPAISCWTVQRQLFVLQQSVEQHTFSRVPANTPITFSAGITSIAILENKQSATDIFTSAQNALLKAQENDSSTIHITTTTKLTNDRNSIVQMQEKQFLFSCCSEE